MIDFEATASANGYFAAGLALGLDYHKGPFFKPIVRHSGITISYSYYAKVYGFKRTKSDSKTIIEADKLDISKKYYIND